jgi:hypothetical protein
MRQALAHRLTRLAQQVQARNAPRWPEADAAVERLRSHAIATLKALLGFAQKALFFHSFV